MSEFAIRPASPSDAAALVALAREVSAEPEGWLLSAGGTRGVADLGLMVAKTHRRLGIGRALLEQAVEWARGVGVTKLELHVFPHNEPAIRLYERFGFEREGFRRGHFRNGGQLIDAILMAFEVPR